MNKVNIFNKTQLREKQLEFKAGDTIRVHQKIKDGDKSRIQVFEGICLSRKHGNGISGMFTIRRVAGDIGVERIFPIHSPFIDKIEVVKSMKVRRAKLYYLRTSKIKKQKVFNKSAESAASKKADKKEE